VWFLRYACAQTDGQTHTHAHHSTPHPDRGRNNRLNLKIVQDKDKWKTNENAYVAYPNEPLTATLGDVKGYLSCVKPFEVIYLRNTTKIGWDLLTDEQQIIRNTGQM